MTCHLCESFCEGSKNARHHVAIFEDEDYEIEQAMVRSAELPTSKTATELRMFFLVELGHILISRKYQETAKHCDIEMLAETPWLKVPPTLSTLMLLERAGQLSGALETFEALKFEGRLRRIARDKHNNAELLSSGFLIEPLIRAIGFYGNMIEALISSLRSKTPSDNSAEVCGQYAVKMLHVLGFTPPDYLSVMQYLHTITESETIDPWQTKLPFLA